MKPIEKKTEITEYEIKIIFRYEQENGAVKHIERTVYDCGELAYQEKIQGRMISTDNSPVRLFEKWLLGQGNPCDSSNVCKPRNKPFRHRRVGFFKIIRCNIQALHFKSKSK